MEQYILQYNEEDRDKCGRSFFYQQTRSYVNVSASRDSDEHFLFDGNMAGQSMYEEVYVGEVGKGISHSSEIKTHKN